MNNIDNEKYSKLKTDVHDVINVSIEQVNFLVQWVKNAHGITLLAGRFKVAVISIQKCNELLGGIPVSGQTLTISHNGHQNYVSNIIQNGVLLSLWEVKEKLTVLKGFEEKCDSAEKWINLATIVKEIKRLLSEATNQVRVSKFEVKETKVAYQVLLLDILRTLELEKEIEQEDASNFDKKEAQANLETWLVETCALLHRKEEVKDTAEPDSMDDLLKELEEPPTQLENSSKVLELDIDWQGTSQLVKVDEKSTVSEVMKTIRETHLENNESTDQNLPLSLLVPLPEGITLSNSATLGAFGLHEQSRLLLRNLEEYETVQYLKVKIEGDPKIRSFKFHREKTTIGDVFHRVLSTFDVEHPQQWALVTDNGETWLEEKILLKNSHLHDGDTLLFRRKPYNLMFRVDPSVLPQVQDPTNEITVPSVLVTLKEALLKVNGLKAVGIFRVMGSRSRTRSLRHSVNMKWNLQAKPEDALCLSTLIMQWFQELPEKLLQHVKLAEYLSHPDTIETVLKEPYRSLFSWLLHLLHQTLHAKEFNKSNALQLAVAWAPVLVDLESPAAERLLQQSATVMYRILGKFAGETVALDHKFSLDDFNDAFLQYDGEEDIVYQDSLVDSFEDFFHPLVENIKNLKNKFTRSTSSESQKASSTSPEHPENTEEPQKEAPKEPPKEGFFAKTKKLWTKTSKEAPAATEAPSSTVPKEVNTESKETETPAILEEEKTKPIVEEEKTKEKVEEEKPKEKVEEEKTKAKVEEAKPKSLFSFKNILKSENPPSNPSPPAGGEEPKASIFKNPFRKASNPPAPTASTSEAPVAKDKEQGVASVVSSLSSSIKSIGKSLGTKSAKQETPAQPPVQEHTSTESEEEAEKKKSFFFRTTGIPSENDLPKEEKKPVLPKFVPQTVAKKIQEVTTTGLKRKEKKAQGPESSVFVIDDDAEENSGFAIEDPEGETDVDKLLNDPLGDTKPKGPSLEQLQRLQTLDGNWELNEGLANAIGIPFDTLNTMATSLLKDQKSPENLQTRWLNLCATALTVVNLHNKYAESKDSWLWMDTLARGWMKNEGEEVGLDSDKLLENATSALSSVVS